MWIKWRSPLLSKVLFKTMVSTWRKFPYLEFVGAGVGDKSRDSIIKSANLIIAILLCVLLRASSRYRQNRQLPMATDCWWNQSEIRLLRPHLSVPVPWRASLVAIAGGIRTCRAVAFDGSSEDLRASLQLLSSTLCSPDTSAIAEVESVTFQDPPLALLLLFCGKIQSCQHFWDVWSWLASWELCGLTVAGWQLEVTQTYIFISSSEQWQLQHWQKEVRKVSRCGRRNKPGLAEMCRRRSNNFSWNHARELGMFLCQNNAEHGRWRKLLLGHFGSWVKAKTHQLAASHFSPSLLHLWPKQSLNIICVGKS